MGFLDSLFGIDDARNAATNAANRNRAESNQAFSYADSLNRPFYDQGVQAYGTLGNFLGLNGAGNQQQAYDNYVEGPDVAFRRQQGINAIDNSSAARTGGVMSGGLLKRLNEFGTGLATQDIGNYLQRLATVGGAGQNAANTMTGARYNSANLTTGANTAEGNAIANASLAGGNILGNLIGGGLNLAGNLYGAGNLGFNPFGGNSKGGMMNANSDAWYGLR
jgi:hypothetical protein